jgi:hypothetical protein
MPSAQPAGSAGAVQGKPYSVDAGGNIQFAPGKIADGLLAAHQDGAITSQQIKDLLPKAVDADNAAAAQQTALSNAAQDPLSWEKALAHGAAKGGSFIAGALPAAALAAPLGAATFGVAPVVAGLVGGLISEHAASAVGTELAKHSDTIKSFADAAQAHPYYDAAGNLVSLAIPGVGAAQNLLEAGGVAAEDAAKAGLSYGGQIGAGIKAVAPTLAKGAGAGALFETYGRQPVENVFNSGLDALGISHDPSQAPTAGSVAQNALLGAMLAGEGVKTSDLLNVDISGVMRRGAERENAGIPLDAKFNDSRQDAVNPPLSPAEQALYQKGKIAVVKDVQNGGVAAQAIAGMTGRQATDAGGRPIATTVDLAPKDAGGPATPGAPGPGAGPALPGLPSIPSPVDQQSASGLAGTSAQAPGASSAPGATKQASPQTAPTGSSQSSIEPVITTPSGPAISPPADVDDARTRLTRIGSPTAFDSLRSIAKLPAAQQLPAYQDAISAEGGKVAQNLPSAFSPGDTLSAGPQRFSVLGGDETTTFVSDPSRPGAPARRVATADLQADVVNGRLAYEAVPAAATPVGATQKSTPSPSHAPNESTLVSKPSADQTPATPQSQSNEPNTKTQGASGALPAQAKAPQPPESAARTNGPVIAGLDAPVREGSATGPAGTAKPAADAGSAGAGATGDAGRVEAGAGPVATRVPFAPETGTLGVPRDQMPQVASEHRGAMANFLSARGMDVSAGEMLPGQLKPSQADYNPGKVAKAGEIRMAGEDNPRRILVSNDGYVIDGHHQWLDRLQNDPHEFMPVLKIDAPAAEILKQIHEFPSAGMEKAPDISPIPGLPVSKDAAEKKSTRQLLEEFMGRVAQRHEDEASGQAVLDHLEDNDISPQTVVKTFWAKTYDNLPDHIQKRFQRMITAVTGFTPGDPIASQRQPDGSVTTITARNWQDTFDPPAAASNARDLEGIERGLIVNMYLANQGMGALKPASAPGPTPLLPGKPEPAKKTPDEPATKSDTRTEASGVRPDEVSPAQPGGRGGADIDRPATPAAGGRKPARTDIRGRVRFSESDATRVVEAAHAEHSSLGEDSPTLAAKTFEAPARVEAPRRTKAQQVLNDSGTGFKEIAPDSDRLAAVRTWLADQRMGGLNPTPGDVARAKQIPPATAKRLIQDQRQAEFEARANAKGSGIKYNDATREISYDPDQFAQSVQNINDHGGDGEGWARASVLEEHKHDLGTQAATFAGGIDKVRDEIAAALPQESFDAMRSVYRTIHRPEHLSDEQAATHERELMAEEYMARYAMRQQGEKLPEEFWQPPEKVAPLLKALDGPQPAAVLAQYARMEHLAPAAKPAPSSPSVATPASERKQAETPTPAALPRPPPRQADEPEVASHKEKPVPEKKQRTFRIPYAPVGDQPDVIDYIVDQGGIQGSTAAKRIAKGKGIIGGAAGDYDDRPNLKGIYQSAVFGGRMAADQMAELLYREHAIGDGTIGAMYAAIDQAMQSRKSGRVENARQALEQKQAERFHRDTGTEKKGDKVVHAGNLAVGDTITVEGQKLKVIDVDPESLDVTLEDHSEYGVQRIASGSVIYVQKMQRATKPVVESPVSPDKLTEREQFRNWLHVAADSPQKLRAIDVDRVMSTARDPAQVERLRSYLLSEALGAEAKAEVRNWKPDDNVPTLRRNENQGDLLSKQTEDLTLTGETGTDHEKVQRAKEAAAKATADAKAKQDREQMALPGTTETPFSPALKEQARKAGIYGKIDAPAKPQITYEQFAAQYRDAFKQGNKYDPRLHVGSQHFSDKMAALADAHPEWLARLEAEEEGKAPTLKPESSPQKRPSQRVEDFKRLLAAGYSLVRGAWFRPGGGEVGNMEAALAHLKAAEGKSADDIPTPEVSVRKSSEKEVGAGKHPFQAFANTNQGGRLSVSGGGPSEEDARADAIREFRQQWKRRADSRVATTPKADPENFFNRSKPDFIGQNRAGNNVFEDKRGVRSVDENGARSTQSVGLRPGGGFNIDSPEKLYRAGHHEYLTADEHGTFDQIIGPPKAALVEAKTPATAPISQSDMQKGASALADWVGLRLAKQQPFSLQQLYDDADMAFGGTQASGAYSFKDATDSLELAVNRWIIARRGLTNPEGSDDVATARRTIQDLQTLLLDNLPTQGRQRNEEMENFQQFSTPPTHAFLANWVANLKPGDTMLEPSAGIGGLAAFAKAAGAQVVVNELSPRRLQFLKTLPFDRFFNEDAEQINNILPADVRPTVVVMNPPFSQAGDRMGGKTDLMVGARHIEAALKRLQPGGRLVAIVGRGMAMDAPTFREWWKRIAASNQVRANIEISGDEYKKYGTTFDNRLLVIDKVAPVVGQELVGGSVQKVDELPALLQGVRDGRPSTARISDQHPGAPAPAPSEVRPDSRPASSAPSATPRPGRTGQGESSARPGGASGSRSPSAPVDAPEQSPEPTESRRPDSEQARADQDALGVRPGASGATPVGGTGKPATSARTGLLTPVDAADVSTHEKIAHDKDTPDTVFDTYQPTVKVAGAKAHPAPLAESSAMASINPPATTYKPKIDRKLIADGRLSDAQLENIVLAGESHSKLLPDGSRRGFFIGDGTGVGKGREIAGTLMDNMNQGRKKAVWISYNSSLFKDAQRDMEGVGLGKDQLIDHSKIKSGDIIGQKEGVLFSTYSTLARTTSQGITAQERDRGYLSPGDVVMPVNPFSSNPDDGIDNPKVHFRITGRKRVLRIGGSDAAAYPAVNVVTGEAVSLMHAEINHNRYVSRTKEIAASRLDQIVKWLGPDFDGVIAFDEAHLMGNAVSIRGARGMKKPSQRALAGVELQKALPKARILYVSATGATEVSNLSYAERLGLWGPGTAFEGGKGPFISSIEGAGVAAMEMVARDLKAMGLYMARSISYHGVTFERLEHKLSTDQTEIYDELAGGWQTVLANMDSALGVTGQAKNGNAVSQARSQFWGTHQRFFSQVMTAMQMPSVIDKLEEDLKAGSSPVIQLTNTNEAQLARILTEKQKQAEEDDQEVDLETLDFTPRQGLMDYIQRGFPTQQYEEYTDEEGNVRTRPAKDSEGNPIQNAEAVAMRDQMLDSLASLRVPENPLDMIINHFGTDNVAEVTGRTRRVVKKKDKNGVERMVQEPWGKTHSEADADSFQADKKRILVFSAAGGTGKSYHADLSAKNQRLRQHYILQSGWRADGAVQGLGRTHRSNQAQPPNYRLVSTNLNAQKRFISTIARRMESLGALTKGQRDSSSQGMFSAADNLETEYSRDAIRDLYGDIARDHVPGVDAADFQAQMGLLLSAEPDVKTFLNRMLNLKVADMNRVWDEFFERMTDRVEMARQRGELDTGMETIRALNAEVTQKSLLHTDAGTGAKTEYQRVQLTQPARVMTVNEMLKRGAKSGFVRNRKSGMVWANLGERNVTAKSGKVELRLMLMNHKYGVSDALPYDVSEYSDSKYEPVTSDAAKPLIQEAIDRTPKTYDETAHMITGALLPIWARLKGAGSVQRITLDNGERILGRRESEETIGPLLRDFQVAQQNAAVTPERVIEHLLANGGRVRLANGTTITRRSVYQDRRLELQNLKVDPRALTPLGMQSERIGYESRYFMPEDKAAAILARVMLNNPVVEGMSGGNELRASMPIFGSTFDQVADEYAARGSKDLVAAGYDAAHTKAELAGEQVASSIRQDLPDKSDREAMPFVIEAGGDPPKLLDFRAKVAASKDAKLSKKYVPVIDHAISNFPRLQAARANHDKIMADNLAELRAAGVDVGEVIDYVTRKLGLPDAVKDLLPNPLFSMGTGNAGGSRYFAKGRVFESLADAIEAGYPPKSTDLADLDRHRISAATRILEHKAFINALKATPSPTDGKPIVGKFEQRKVLSGETERVTPKGYTSVRTTAGEVPIHDQFAHLFKDLYGDSAVRRVAAFRALLKAAATVKVYTLFGDTFHIGRQLYKMATGGGGLPFTMVNGKPQVNIRNGLALIERTDADNARAVASGEITQREADYARDNRPQFEELVNEGLNVGRVADNLVQQAHAHIPGMQWVNDWIFSKLSRSAMVQTALVNYQRNLKQFPERSQQENARQTAKEMNELFGNLQNQGLFKNKTFQDIARLVFLAPQWAESQLRYEGRAYGQFGRAAYDAVRGVPPAGGGGGKGPPGPPGGPNGAPIGPQDDANVPRGTRARRLRLGNAARAMAVGFTSLFLANQVINWLSRKQFTWDNEEDGHKLDAFIPGGKRGFWFDPFEIAGEYAHAAFKYAAQHEDPVDVATHILSNKLSPIGRGVKDALTGRDYAGRPFLSNTDRFREAAVDALPSPIPLGSVMEKDPRAPLGYRLSRQPGSVEKQLLQSFGAKVSYAQSPRSQMFALAQPFRADKVGTDSAGEYTALRAALDNDEEKSSQAEVQWLLGRGKSIPQIERAVNIQTDRRDGSKYVRPEMFAGSADREQEFVKSLSAGDAKLYAQAQQDNVDNAVKFLTYTNDLLSTNADAAKLARINGGAADAAKAQAKSIKTAAPPRVPVAPAPAMAASGPTFATAFGR